METVEKQQERVIININGSIAKYNEDVYDAIITVTTMQLQVTSTKGVTHMDLMRNKAIKCLNYVMPCTPVHSQTTKPLTY